MTYYKPDLYGDTQGKKFDLIATYCPNEENDPWVRYVNVDTKEEYTCRKAAFDSRFFKLP